MNIRQLMKIETLGMALMSVPIGTIILLFWNKKFGLDAAYVAGVMMFCVGALILMFSHKTNNTKVKNG